MYNVDELSLTEKLQRNEPLNNFCDTIFVGNINNEIRIDNTIFESGDKVIAYITCPAEKAQSVVHIAPYEKLSMLSLDNVANFAGYWRGTDFIEFKNRSVSSTTELKKIINIDTERTEKLNDAFNRVKEINYKLYDDRYDAGLLDSWYFDYEIGEPYCYIPFCIALFGMALGVIIAFAGLFDNGEFYGKQGAIAMAISTILAVGVLASSIVHRIKVDKKIKKLEKAAKEKIAYILDNEILVEDLRLTSSKNMLALEDKGGFGEILTSLENKKELVER